MKNSNKPIKFFTKILLDFKLFCMLLLVLLVLSIIGAVTLGTVDIKSSEIAKIIANSVFSNDLFESTWKSSTEMIVKNIRLPRILLSAVVGSGLSLAGVLMQALTKNSLAEPFILGISSGASAGAVAAILLGIFAVLGENSVSLCAFAGALLATYMVFKIANWKGRFTPTRLVLTGVAISAMFSSITSYMVFKATDMNKMRSALFWMSGSFSGSSWNQLLLPFIVLVGSFIPSLFFSKALDTMLLGEDTAITLGVNTKSLRRIIIIVSTLLTAVMVSVSGVIGFVGLIIPHICRTLVGSTHKKLIPISVLCGSIFLIWADACARLIVAPEELPIGVVTSFLGAPFFLWLLRKSSYSFGGKE